MIAAGAVLTQAADAIAETTGLGRAWIGAVLLAGAASIPEIATDMSAVRMHAPNLAAGDLFGSSLANMAIFLVLDLASPSGSIFAGLSPDHAIAGMLAVVLMSLGLASILYRAERRFFMVEPASALMLVAYALSIWIVYLYSGAR